MLNHWNGRGQGHDHIFGTSETSRFKFRKLIDTE